MPVVSERESSVSPRSRIRAAISATCRVAIFPSKGQPNAVEMAPETSAPFACANATQSLKPSMSSSGVLFRLAFACDSLAETVSLTFVIPDARARSTPFRFATSARYSTPAVRRNLRATSSVSANCGTAFGWTYEPISTIRTPASTTPSIRATFCSTESRVASF